MEVKHIYFSGQVQGVGFRFAAQSLAKRYRVTGWVKNLPDGRVEMMADGDEKSIDKMIKDLYSRFLVTGISAEYVEVSDYFTGFDMYG